jgi:hypothetical protein
LRRHSSVRFPCARVWFFSAEADRRRRDFSSAPFLAAVFPTVPRAAIHVRCFRWSVLNLETAGRSFHRVSVSPPANELSESLFRSRRATVGLGSRSTVRPRLSLSAPRALLEFASHGARREDLSHRIGKLIRAPGFRRPPEARRRCFLFAFELRSFSIQLFSPSNLRATGHRHATRTLACLGQHADEVTALRRVNLGSPGELCHRFGFARG